MIAALLMLPGVHEAAAEDQTAAIKIGQVTLDVPLGQVPGLRGRAIRGGAAVNAGTYTDGSSALRLHYLLPDFEAPTDRNREEFLEASWRRNIMISLSYPNQLGDRHEVMYGPRGFLSASSPEVTSSVDGYREFRWLGEAIYISRSDPDFYLICVDEPGHSHGGPPGLAWWPHCTHDLSWHGVKVSYTFSVEFMKDSREIDTKVHQILDGMLIDRQHRAN